MNKIFKLIGVGTVYCFFQRLGESILGLIITNVRNASNVNIEGTIQFAIIGFLLSIIPYLIIFPLVNGLANKQIPNSILSAGINILVIFCFYFSGIIQKDPASFLVASFVLSFLFIIIEQKSLYITTYKNNA